MVLLYNTPNDLRCSFGPIPESISIWGELTAPAETITSLLAIISCFMLSRTNDTPVALLSFIMIYTGRIKSKINNLKIMVWFYRIMNIKLSHLIKSFNFYYCVRYNYYTYNRQTIFFNKKHLILVYSLIWVVIKHNFWSKMYNL